VAAASCDGVEVWAEESLLPEFGQVHGKGDVLWRALSRARGDLVVIADTDNQAFPGGLGGRDRQLSAGPTGHPLRQGGLRRPFADGELSIPDGGGRVTELLAKPLLNVFDPELAGEFGGTGIAVTWRVWSRSGQARGSK
jgi:glucosyl-3-phosphoglycerate synthase